MKELQQRLEFSRQALAALNQEIGEKEGEILGIKNTISFFKEISDNLRLEIAGLNVELDKTNSRLRQQRYVCNLIAN